MSRETFLERVRRAAELGRAHRVHLHPLPQDVGYVGVSGDLCERFAAEVEAVGGIPHVVADLSAARATLEGLLDEVNKGQAMNAVAELAGEESGSPSALCWQHELLTRLGLAEVLQARGIGRLDFVSLAPLSPERRRAAMLQCQVGITSCDWAIAETGSLLLCSRTGRERAASLLPPVYIAIVERRQIVPDLIDAIGLLGGNVERSSFRSGQKRGDDRGNGTDEVERNSFRSSQDVKSSYGNGINSVVPPRNGMNSVLLPSNAVLITGPSKTGDIELQLTTGVHGPGKWHVIVIRS